MTSRVNVLLLLGLLASCLYLVKVAYDSRRLFAALERAQLEGRTLESDHKRLDAERQAQATHLRVEKVARERLRMRGATAAVTQYVMPDAPSDAASEAAR